MSISPIHMLHLINTDKGFRSLVGTYGAPVYAQGDCSHASPGDICLETACVAGKKLVMKCDATKGCTEYEEMPC
jgi:hypothetical protein